MSKKHNDCRFLNPILSTCTGPFSPDSCAYTGNQETCCMYDNGKKDTKIKFENRQYIEEPEGHSETGLEWVERVEQELRNMGVEFTRLGTEIKKVKPPHDDAPGWF